MGRIRAVTVEALVRQYRPNYTIEVDRLPGGVSEQGSRLQIDDTDRRNDRAALR
jgi:hypothetical protein